MSKQVSHIEISELFLLLLKVQSGNISQSGWSQTIIKHVTPLTFVVVIEHLSPSHPERVVCLPRDVVPGLRLLRIKEARPSGARVKLCLCGEELGSAANAGVLVVFSRPGSLCGVSSGNLILDTAQDCSVSLIFSGDSSAFLTFSGGQSGDEGDVPAHEDNSLKD